MVDEGVGGEIKLFIFDLWALIFKTAHRSIFKDLILKINPTIPESLATEHYRINQEIRTMNNEDNGAIKMATYLQLGFRTQRDKTTK